LIGLPESSGGRVRSYPQPALSSSPCSHITRGMNNRPVGGRSSETQSHLTIINQWWSLRLAGDQSQAVRCVVTFCRNLASVDVNKFSCIIYFIITFHKCAFNMTCTDNAAINCCSAQKGSITFNCDQSCKATLQHKLLKDLPPALIRQADEGSSAQRSC